MRTDKENISVQQKARIKDPIIPLGKIYAEESYDLKIIYMDCFYDFII